MQTRQLGTSLLRATVSSPSPFLLPASAVCLSPLPSVSSISRSFTSNAVLSAATGTARASAPTTTSSRAPKYSANDISRQLGDLIPKTETAMRRQTSSRKATAAQENLADSMGIDRSLTAPLQGLSIRKPDPPKRLDAFVGRSVEVMDRSGLATALKVLEINLARNGVKRDARMQKYHERAGLKRKRLRMERWRKRFRDGFKATVQKVSKMRKMGW